MLADGKFNVLIFAEMRCTKYEAEKTFQDVWQKGLRLFKFSIFCMFLSFVFSAFFFQGIAKWGFEKKKTGGRRKSIIFYLWDNFEKRLETWVCVDMWKNHFSSSLWGHPRQRMVLLLLDALTLEGLFTTPRFRALKRLFSCFLFAIAPRQNKNFTVTF